MKKILKLFSLFLVIALLLCFGGCKEAPAKTAKQLIEAGEYQKAYDQLLSIKNPTEEEKTLLKGFFFREVERTADGTKTAYSYDERGLLIARNTPTGRTGWVKEEFTYDDKGNLLTIDTTDRDGRWEKIVYTYDEKGNVLTEDYTHYAYTAYTYTYTYDEKGNMLTKCNSMDNPNLGETGKLQRCYTYTYDEKGNLIKEEFTVDPPFSVAHWDAMVYTHDENGNVLSADRYDPTGNYVSTATYAYTYDDNGNVLSYKEGGQTTVWEYDEANRVKSKVTTSFDGTERAREEYTYDDHGNPITHYKKAYDYRNANEEEVTYSSTWRLFYNPEWAEKPVDPKIPPEPVYSLKYSRFPT